MAQVLQPCQILVTALAGWVNRHEQAVIDPEWPGARNDVYLWTECQRCNPKKVRGEFCCTTTLRNKSPRPIEATVSIERRGEDTEYKDFKVNGNGSVQVLIVPSFRSP